MKKKIVSLLLTAALALSLTPAAFALGAFADVGDAETAQNVEVLRMMGVLEGDGNGAFRPYSSLTRAEFCKMAVVLTGKRSVVVSYSKKDVGFTDMRSSHWAAGYVNYAASKEAGLIHGMPDGTFAPDRAITYGEAVAILTRLLGYTDKDTGGIWPDGYLALAGAAGMTKGLSLAGNATITRAQAAKLFVNALTSKNDDGKMLLGMLGYSCDTAKKPVTLWSIDMVNGQLRLSDGTKPEMAAPMESTVLVGVKGHVVTNAEGKAVTFLPTTSNTGSGAALSDAAIIVSANGSTAGFDTLTGGATGYGIYRNGVAVTAAELKKNDVVIYNAAANAVLACDTRVSVYYENCSPTPAAPNTVTVLGGTEFDVLPTAQQSLSRFKPGENMTILLTADGRVAGATESSSDSDAFAYVSTDGGVSLLCGDSLLALNAQTSDKLTMDTSKVLGTVARISQSGSGGKSAIYCSRQTGMSGNLDPVERTLGTRKVASGALVFKGDKLTSLAELGTALVPEGRIAFARANSSGEIDLIVIKDNTGEYYGRVTVSGGAGDSSKQITVDFGPNGSSVSRESNYGVRTGEYVSFRYNSNNGFTGMAPLTQLSNVAATAWIGDELVNYGGQTYFVSEKVICYNRDIGSWFDDLETAKAYGGKLDLYVKDGVVHVIEVHN